MAIFRTAWSAVCTPPKEPFVERVRRLLIITALSAAGLALLVAAVAPPGLAGPVP